MALVRILVDGYSLLHSWPELAPGKPRHSPAAREELIAVLTRYYDAAGIPITIVFDGRGQRGGEEPVSTPEVEVLYSRAGQTADQIIERAAFRLKAHGEVLAVTNDFAERDTVSSVGGMTSNCANFIRTVQDALAEMESQVRRYNQQERAKFRAH